tara:strand:+ start:1921 stop:2289 length:369 start_codon:yes stop_codon:yes gene_type:complete
MRRLLKCLRCNLLRGWRHLLRGVWRSRRRRVRPSLHRLGHLHRCRGMRMHGGMHSLLRVLRVAIRKAPRLATGATRSCLGHRQEAEAVDEACRRAKLRQCVDTPAERADGQQARLRTHDRTS